MANEVPSANDERTALGVHGLETCAAEIGRPPSRRAYDAWRAKKSMPEEWVSSSMIRIAFGSWPKALEAIGLEPAPDVLAPRLLRLSARFSEDECLWAVRECVKHYSADGKYPLKRLDIS